MGSSNLVRIRLLRSF
ncbi:hypothetical protein LINPERPRIM_LOCUS7144 [Linum perenne]